MGGNRISRWLDGTIDQGIFFPEVNWFSGGAVEEGLSKFYKFHERVKIQGDCRNEDD